MQHLGDISKINGAEIPPVDLITFGSPCQDLSVAGKRAGIKHEVNGDEEATRSGLFMEAVRIIKEMRESTNGKYPRFALWENVPGAFSSNKGEDFRIVCEELIKIVEPQAIMPEVPKTGWAYADSYSGNGWSIAYRTFDAQYWGVPQRRRRIHLVADFSGECASEILFKREGVRGNLAQSGKPGQGTATNVESCIGAKGSTGRTGLIPSDVLPSDTTQATDPQNGAAIAESNDMLVVIDSIGGQGESAKVTDVAPTLKAGHCKFPPSVMLTAGFCTEHSAQAGGIGYQDECAPTMRTGTVAAVVCATYDARGNGNGRTANTITGDHENRITDYTSIVCKSAPVAYHMGNGQLQQINMSDKCSTLDCMHDQKAVLIDMGKTMYPYIVRRLTPTECARLQGFSDDWGHPELKDSLTDEEYEFWLDVRNTHAAINGKKVKEHTKAQMLSWYNKLHSDSAEYKMWGNGIALPPALYCMQGIAEVVQREAVH